MAKKMLTTHRLARPAKAAARPWKPILSHSQPDPQAAKGDIARLYPRGIARPKAITRIMTRTLPRPSDKAAPQAPVQVAQTAEGAALRAEPTPAKTGPGRPRKTQGEPAK